MAVISTSVCQMRRLITAALITSALLFSAVAVSSAGPSSNQIRWSTFTDKYMSPLDGQGDPSSPVYNTTGCVWNDQDERTNIGTGDLTGTTSNTICMVADYDDSSRGNYPKHITFQIYAASDTLNIILSNDSGSVWYAAPSVKSGNKRKWELCVADPVADTGNVDEINPLTYWPEIPGTNGGRGQIVNYALDITSTIRTTRKVVAYFEVAQGGVLGSMYNTLKSTPCPDNDGL